MQIIMTIALITGSLWSLRLLLRRLDRMISSWSNYKTFRLSLAISTQFLLDLVITVGLTIGASSLLGVTQGGPVGIAMGIVISYKIEKWYDIVKLKQNAPVDITGTELSAL